MTCINENTVFYKSLEKNYDSKEIAKIDLALESENFKNWYGQGERDTFGNPSLAKDLYLLNDKGEQITLNDLLNDKTYEKRKFYKKDLTYLDKVNDFLKDSRVGIEKRISAFRGTEYAERLEKLLQALDELDKNDHISALSTHSEYILKTVEDLEGRFYHFDKINKAKLSKEEVEKNDKAFKNFLIQSSNFLQTFSKIDTLETPKIESLDVYKIIKTLKDTEERVTALQHRVNSEVEGEVRKTLEGLIKNPEIRRGVMDFLSAQADETKMQMLMDALGDSHVPFLAAVDKFYKLNMAEKEDEVKDKQRQWRTFVKSKGDFDGFLDKILETNNGKRTGRFIQKYNGEFYDSLYELNDRRNNILKTQGIDSDEYKKVNSEYFNFKNENLEQKYIKEYYDTLNLLIPEAREARQELDEKRSAILGKTKDKEGKVVESELKKLTLEDWEELKNIDKQMKWLKSNLNPDGTKKEGLDLEIANSLFKYSKAMGQFYYTKGVAQKAFDKARKEAEEKGSEYLEQWDYYNTSEQFDNRFWEKFKDLTSQYPKTEEIENISDEIKQMLLPFKNEKGEVQVDKLSDEIKQKLNELKSRRSLLKGEVSKTMDAKMKMELASKFKNLVEFVPTAEYLKVFKQKQDELEAKTITQEEYDTWFRENHESDIYTEEINPIDMWTTMKPRNKKMIESKPNSLWQVTDIKPEFHNDNYEEDDNGFPVPKEKWLNDKYSRLNDSDKEGLNQIKELLTELVAHSKDNIIKKGYIPAVPKDTRGLIGNIMGKEVAKEEKNFTEKAITESDEIVKFIPFKYIKRLNQEELPKVEEGMSEEQVAEIEAQRKKIVKANKIGHGEVLNYDLAETMEHFIQAALTNKYKTNMEADVKLFQQQLRQMKIKQIDAKGNKIFDKIKSKVSGEKVEYETSAIGSNTEKHFNEWLEAVFYEDFNLEEGKLSDWASKIQNFTSLRAMGFNVLSGLNNKLIGNINERMESAGGRYFNYSHYREARRMYFANITNFLADHNKKESSNFMTAYLKEMDVLISEDELANKPEGAIKTALHKLKMVRDAAYFMQHVGEHQIQNATLIAMSNSHRIVDGEIMSFNEYFEKKKFNVDEAWKNGTFEDAMKAIDNNQQLKKSLVEEFENFTKVIDAFEFKDGYVNLKDNLGITKKEIHEFRERIIGVNQRLHGIYNTEDSGMIQRYALGRLAIQFRKWMRPGWNMRFGSKFGKKLYNERIRDYEEGMYITTAKYLSSPFVTNWKEHRKAQEGIAVSAFKTLTSGFKDLIFNSKIRWHIMDEVEKANVRKTAAEFTFLIAVTAIGFMAKHMKGDGDDDEKLKKKMLTYTLFEADRLFGELTNFTPIGIVREGSRLFKSPSPVFNTFEDAGKLAGALFLYPFRDEEERKFKTGVYHGKDRVSVYAKDMIPVYNQFQRLANMSSNNQRYGMFR